MKLFLVCAILVLFSCGGSSVEEAEIHQSGKISIGNGMYLKRIVLSYGTLGFDKVYIVVDENDKIVSGANANYTAGKTQESTTSIVASPAVARLTIDELRREFLTALKQIDSLDNLQKKSNVHDRRQTNKFQ